MADERNREVNELSPTTPTIRDGDGYRLVAVHDDRSVIPVCAEIMNEEWKRSLAARVALLEKSRPEFPLSLALVSPEGATIGHSRLVPVLDKPRACIVLSVVVPRSLRGRGQGRRLMTLTEEFATKRGYDVMYLTTHDKQGFYERLGYARSESVTSLGEMSHLADDPRFRQLISSISSESRESGDVARSPILPPPSGAPNPPPPANAPPPPPPPPLAKPSDASNPEAITWYKKLLK